LSDNVFINPITHGDNNNYRTPLCCIISVCRRAFGSGSIYMVSSLNIHEVVLYILRNMLLTFLREIFKILTDI